MRRLLMIILGFIAAMLAAAASEVLFALPPAELLALEGAARGERALEMGALMLRAATHTAIFCAGFAPIAILIGELLRLRDWTYYVIAGIVIALGGFLAQYASENASQPTIVNNYALIAFVTSGALGGFVYWMVAGHNAGRRRPAARIAPAETPAARESGKDSSGEAEDERPGPGHVQGETAADVKRGDGEQLGRTALNREDEAPTAARMTSVPVTGSTFAVRPRLALAGSVPDAGPSKPPKV